MAGYEVLTEGRGSNSGTCIINLKNWSDRKRTARQIIVDLEEKCRRMSNVKLEFFEPPAVPGFGTAGGISMLVLDKTFSADYQRLGEVTDKFMAALKKRKEVTNLFTFYAANYPQYELIINNDVAMQKGVSIKAAMDNLNILIGSTWEQGFIRFNLFYKVFVQAKPEFRRYPEDLDNLFVKNDKGEMVPYSAFMTIKKKQGLNEITRYNLYTSAAIQCAPAAGYSTGQAIQAIKEVGAETLPRGFDVGWSGLAYDEAKKGNEAVYIFLIVVAFVYLVLVGQYESFILPLAVILSLPVGLFGSFFFLQAMGLANDVYAQIGLVMLVGLLGKNAILIVEFAVQRRLEGVSLQEAAVEGAKLRFRPIQMTSFAFIAGLLPLVVATGAGAIGNRTIGTTAAGGMLVGTVIGVLVIPGLYYLFGQLDGGRNSSRTSRINLSARGSTRRTPRRTRRRRRSIRSTLLRIAIVCSMLLVLPSCGIPKLRQAEPRPDLPAGFNGATSSENSLSSDSFPNRKIRYLSHNPHLDSRSRIDTSNCCGLPRARTMNLYSNACQRLRTLMNEPCTSQELIAYYLFGGIADKRKLLKDEADEPLSLIFERKAHEARDRESDRLQHAAVGSAGLYPHSP